MRATCKTGNGLSHLIKPIVLHKVGFLNPTVHKYVLNTKEYEPKNIIST